MTEAVLALGGADPATLGIAHEVAVDPLNGSASIAVPLELTPGRSGFGPVLTLRYDSTGSRSVFGTGWRLDGVPAITVATRRGLPTYTAADSYLESRAGELVPARQLRGGAWLPRVEERPEYTVRYWRSRHESAYLRVEQWVHRATGRVHWRARDVDGVLTVYGLDAGGSTVIADPDEPSRVYAWLAEAQYDDAGNAIRYGYAPETADGVDRAAAFERRHRRASTNRYLTHIRYANSEPVAPDEPEPVGNEWHLHVVLDYGDHDSEVPRPEPDRTWPARIDPSSTYRPGFEVRTHRLCRRVLKFHHLEALGSEPVLVGAYTLDHIQDPAGTTLRGLHYTGFRSDGGRRDLPPLRFEYSRPSVASDFTATDVDNVPAGLTGSYRWLDLYGDGLAGILFEIGSAWYYTRNEGGGRFGAQELVAERPAYPVGQAALVDFDADGDPNLAVLYGRSSGYYAYDRDAAAWRGFRPFPALPHAEAAGEYGQWLDLDGDGRADLVVSDATRLTWYPSLGRDGFGEPVQVRRTDDTAPFLEDPQTRFLFADMTGDGLADQVRVGPGRVEYWPSLGRGRFGPSVLMADAPALAPEAEFDASRVRLVDLDGTGTADLVYLGPHDVRWWRNAGGNRWLPGGRVMATIDNVANVRVVDFLGDGTACLVWSSPLAGDGNSLRYLRLTGGVTPNLLVGADNGRGAVTRVSYGSSAAHYMADRRAGRPWRTRLPNHVPVVDRIEVLDLVGGGRSVTRYGYHDGRLDADERLLLFGAVDQYDTDPDAPEVVGACVRNWFHPGTPLRGPLPGAWRGDPAAPVVPPHAVEEPAELAPGDDDRAHAALAGAIVREEVFAVGPDGRLAEVPVSVEQQGYRIRRLQPGATGHEPAFAVQRAERLNSVYEGVAGDPRVTHELTLDADGRGTALLSCTVAYPRTGPAGAEAQARAVATATETVRVVHVDEPDRYAPGIEVEQREYELRRLADIPLTWEDARARVRAAVAAAVAFDADPGAGEARVTGWRRTFYWDDVGAGPLPIGHVGARRIRPHHAEEACITTSTAERLIAGPPVDPSSVAGLLAEAGYTTADGYWWRRGPTHYYGDRFDLLARVERADGATTTIEYDATALTAVAITDPTGLVTRTEIDHHLLAPYLMTDPNGTVSEVQFDPLGVPVVATTHGSLEGQPHGQEPLDRYVARESTFEAVVADPAAFVQNASRYVHYDLAYDRALATAPRVVTLVRESLRHDRSATPVPDSRVVVEVTHLDGYGRPVQIKRLAEPGDAGRRDASGRLVTGPDGRPLAGPVATRWHTSGLVRRNAQQQIVRRYQPFFSSTAAYEPDEELAAFGVAERYAYDAVGRQVRHDWADGTFERVEYAPWQIRSFDAVDTVTDSGYRLLREGLPATDPERMAYERAAVHAGTPVVTQLDPAGLQVLTLEPGAGEPDRVTETVRDHTGEVIALVDPRGLVAFRYGRDMLGRVWRTASADAGITRELPDPFDRPGHGWDASGRHARRGFDAADRPLWTDIDGRRVEEAEYGDGSPATAAVNACGLPVRQHDPAGTLAYQRYGLGGEPLRVERRLAADHRSEPDWSGPVPLDDEVHINERAFDALGRVRREALPDGTIRELRYLAGGGLDRVTVATPDGATHLVLDGATYTATGERQRLTLGNGVSVDYVVDPETARVRRRTARRLDGVALSDIAYTYDPLGNVVRIADTALPFLRGVRVAAEATYTYDAFSQLVRATGRVHQGLLEHDYRPDRVDRSHLRFDNRAAVEPYTRTYRYDLAGNILQIRHAGASRSWLTRLWVSSTSNRALPARDPSGAEVSRPEERFDAAGNPASLAHLRGMAWDSYGRLARAVVIARDDGGPDDAEYYCYDATGTRVRAVFERLVSGRVEVTETRYLDGCEIRRISTGGTVVLDRLSSHILDEQQRLATIHRWRADTTGRETDDPSAVRVRYLLADHLGSVDLELDENARVISYEEYFPYGGTAFLAGDDAREVNLRAYRFCGNERDAATRLYYVGHRYYAPWVGRWLSPDPIGASDDGLNLYAYVRNNPVTFIDPDGLQISAPSREPRELQGQGQDAGRPPITVTPDFAVPREGAVGSKVVPTGPPRGPSSTSRQAPNRPPVRRPATQPPARGRTGSPAPSGRRAPPNDPRNPVRDCGCRPLGPADPELEHLLVRKAPTPDGADAEPGTTGQPRQPSESEPGGGDPPGRGQAPDTSALPQDDAGEPEPTEAADEAREPAEAASPLTAPPPVEPEEPRPEEIARQLVGSGREAVRAAAEATITARDDPRLPGTKRLTVASLHGEAARNFRPGQSIGHLPYNLWSQGPNASDPIGPGQRAAIRRPGFIMEDTRFEQKAEKIARKLPEWSRTKYSGRYDPGIADATFRRIWHPTSDTLAVRAGLAQTPVTSSGLIAEPSRGLAAHGAPEKTVQYTREIPRIQKFGGAVAGVGIVAGVLALVGSQSVSNATVRRIAVAAGGGEVAAGASYLGGVLALGRSRIAGLLTRFGSIGGRFFGGVGMSVLGGYAIVRAWRAGDTQGLVTGGLTTGGGVLILAGLALSAPKLAVVGAGIGVGVGVYQLGRWPVHKYRSWTPPWRRR